jgi:hypothetical protein
LAAAFFMSKEQEKKAMSFHTNPPLARTNYVFVGKKHSHLNPGIKRIV